MLVPRAACWSGDLADVEQILGEYATRLVQYEGCVVVGRRRHEIEVRRDTAYGDRTAQELGHGCLEVRSLPLGVVLEERLRLGEPEGDERPIDAERPAPAH